MRHFRHSAIAVVTATLLAACGGSDSNNEVTRSGNSAQPAISAAYTGSWVAPGYGTAISIGTNTVAVYQFTSDYCFLQDDFDGVTTALLERSVRLTDNQDELEWYAGSNNGSFGAPGTLFNKQTSLPASCEDNMLMPDSDATNGELYAMFSQIMAEYYVDFSINNVDWPAVTYQQSLNVTSQDMSLYEAIYQSFVPLADGHNSWSSPTGVEINVLSKPTHIMTLMEEFADANGLDYPLNEAQITQQILAQINKYIEAQLSLENEILASYATSDISTAADGQVFWAAIDDVGYLRVDSMTGYTLLAEDADDLDHVNSSLQHINGIVDEALETLADARGLIIDIRNNGGGSDFISLAIASHFTDSAFTGYSKYARDGEGFTEPRAVEVTPAEGERFTGRPVVLLTSSNTASAAESFTVMMSQLDNVTLVGETTHGIFSDRLQWLLPEGNVLSMSNEVYLTPDGEWLEGEGITPDIQVPFFTVQERLTGTDSGLEAALAFID